MASVKSKISPFLLCFCSFFCVFSQDYSINGSVEDSEKAAIAFANVQLLSSSDSTLVNGASSDQTGHFVITGVIEGAYLIKASFIENESAILPITVSSDTEVGVLVVMKGAQNLDEVVVTQNKPRLERKVDRLVFNIENTALAAGDIWSVLKRTPSVIVLNNDITVKGNSAVGILINGRKVNLPKNDILNLLSGTSANGVEAIEVIMNPPVKYNAEDGVLINIVTKKNLIAGYNGSLYNKYTQAVLPKHMVGTDHYFKGKKVGLSVNYSFNQDRNVTYYTDITNFLTENRPISTWTSEQEYLRGIKRHNLRAFFDYDIDEKNRLSFSSIVLWAPKGTRKYDTQTMITNDSLWSGFDTFNNSSDDMVNTSYYLEYEHKINERGAEVSLNSHYTFYDDKQGQILETDFLDTAGSFADENNFTTNSEQYIHLYSLQADYTTPLATSSTFDMGVRYAGIQSKNIFVQEGFDRNQPGVDPTSSGNFDYDESIYAAYASYSANWDLWKLRSGLRAEYTETLGAWALGNQRNENNYFELFPSFSLQYTPNNHHDFNLYYYRRIERPRYALINPFQIFQNNFSTIEGDPKLLPATRHYFAGGYTLNGSYTIELFYRKEKNTLDQIVFQSNDTRLLRFVSTNLDANTSYGIDFSVNRDLTDFWNFYLLASFFDDNYTFRDALTQTQVENKKLTWYVTTTNGFTFLKDKSLTADLTYLHTASRAFANREIEPFGSLSVLFRKTLWNGKASISTGLEDIFNQGNQLSSRDYLDQNGTSYRRRENRLFTLGFLYKFGNVQIRNNQKSKGVEERNRL